MHIGKYVISMILSALLFGAVLAEEARDLPSALRRLEREKVHARMVRVPGGKFLMGTSRAEAERLKVDFAKFGADIDWFADEMPQHAVRMDGFRIGKTEVTNAEYETFIRDGGYTDPQWWSEEGWQWRQKRGIQEPLFWHNPRFNAPQQPVTGVSWYEANAYAKWIGCRLPTEAEWEYAARGTDGRRYPWGGQWPDNARAIAGLDFRTGAPGLVGRRPLGRCPFGSEDMAGNVWEWCADGYSADYYKQPKTDNPRGPRRGSYRVIRGGGWPDMANFLRCAVRGRVFPFGRNCDIGFRIAADESAARRNGPDKHRARRRTTP